MYDEPYEYTDTNGKIGNLTRKGDGYYYYDSTRKHAVRSVIGTGGSSLSITIRAKGTSYGGVWPSMSLRVNGAVVKTWTVNTTSYTNYTHSTTLSGNDVLEVAHTNDESTRTLYVDYVIVNGTTVQAEGGAMVYDRGTGSAAYDGFDVIAGREMLDVSGALRFVKGAKARNAGYDANGNMTSRLEDGKAYLQTYDSENRLTTVNNLAIGQTTTFTYDGDGNRVKVAIGSTTTVYIGNYYENNTITGVITKYYYAGGQRVAMRAGSTLYYLFSDHLGSSSVSVRGSDGNTLTQRYYPWGTIRPGPDNGLPTDYTFTGQKLDTSTGLMYYVARYYDPALGRFIQPDTIVPDVQDVSLIALTVSFANPVFVQEVGRENRWRSSEAVFSLEPSLSRSEKAAGLGVVQWYQVAAGSISRRHAGDQGSSSSSQFPSTGPVYPQNLNRFTYVCNNPAAYTDPSGYWTFGIGLGGTLGLGKGLSFSIMIVFDDNGNVGVAVSGGGGAYAGGGASGGLVIQRTNADTIQNLKGPVVQAGGSASLGISAGFEWVVQQGAEDSIQGWNLNIGVGASGALVTPVEFHGMLEMTEVKTFRHGRP